MKRNTEFITEFNTGKGQICARPYFHSTPFAYRLNAWRPRQVCIPKHFPLSNSQERITSWLNSYHRRSRRTCPRSRAGHRRTESSQCSRRFRRLAGRPGREAHRSAATAEPSSPLRVRQARVRRSTGWHRSVKRTASSGRSGTPGCFVHLIWF